MRPGPLGAVAGVAFAVAFAAGCGPARSPQRHASLRVVGTPPNASVVVDDVYVGTLELVAAHGVAVPPGVHRVSVEAPGYFPADHLVDAQPSRPARLEVALEKEPE